MKSQLNQKNNKILNSKLKREQSNKKRKILNKQSIFLQVTLNFEAYLYIQLKKQSNIPSKFHVAIQKLQN